MMKLLDKMKEIRKNLHENKGFTLVELIVVIVILAILIGVSVSGYSKYIGQSKVNTDKNNAETVRAAIVNAQAADGVYEGIINGTIGEHTFVISNTGALSGTDTCALCKEIKRAVDTDNCNTQLTGGTVTLKATPTTDGEGASAKKTGDLKVTITPNDKYGDAWKASSSTPAGGED